MEGLIPFSQPPHFTQNEIFQCEFFQEAGELLCSNGNYYSPQYYYNYIYFPFIFHFFVFAHSVGRDDARFCNLPILRKRWEIIHETKNEKVILKQAILLKEATSLHSGACNEFNLEPRRGPVGCQAIPRNYRSDPIHHHTVLLNIVWEKFYSHGHNGHILVQINKKKKRNKKEFP